ncbi:MAG: right-handed parallel beta-helix repeat-containing protein [Blastocatellia bacterium]
MDKMRSTLNLLAVFIVCAICASMAQAQATRTWVSGVGDDANPCSRTAPCKTFAGAISKTAASGEISVLDPGGFGAVTITKAITINGDGTLAGILSSLTNGIIVNAGVNDVVIIRNISINGAGNGINGIRFLAGKQLIVQNCSIYGVTNHGIDVSLAAAAKLTVINSTISNCGQVGVRVSTSAGIPTASLDNVHIQSCGIGFDTLAGTTATISNSVITHITNQALVAENTSVINAEGCVMSHSGTGVSAFTSGATVRLSNCDILNNSTGISIAAGGTVASFQNNRNAGNTTAGAPNANLTQQ